MNKPKNIARIDISEAKQGKDFTIETEIALMSDYSFKYFKEGMDMSDVLFTQKTPYSTELVNEVYEIPDHEIDFKLAVTLGLGVIKELSTGHLFLYHTDTESENRQDDEALRMGMYYQIAHPEYDDVRLDGILNTKGGEQYIRHLLFIKSDEVIEKLKDIFESKKGEIDNVIDFKKRG